jgi:hypothetical protein
MSHSEGEGENYWPGYVDALTSMVQVLAFVMMMLAMAVFVLSQSVSKHAVEAIAKAVNAQTKPGAGVKELTEAIMDRLQQSPPPAMPVAPVSSAVKPPSPSPPLAGSKAAPGENETSPSREKLVELRVGDSQNHKDKIVEPPSDAPHVVIDFDDRSYRIDQEREHSLSAFVETNKAVEQSQIVFINAYAYSGDGALSEARRLAYYRAMTTRKQLLEAKVRPENVRVNVNDTADQAKGSTVEVATGGSSSH